MIAINGDATAYREPDYYPEPTEKKKVKPPFKLCFVCSPEVGRSSLSKIGVDSQYPIITPKFYASHERRDVVDFDADVIDEWIKKAFNTGPKHKYDEPLLESQEYGWFQNKHFETRTTNPYLTFPQRRSDMVKIQCMILNSEKAEKQLQQQKMSMKIDGVK